MSGSRARLEELRGYFPPIAPQQAFDLQQRGAVVVDIRDSEETAGGIPTGALHIARGFLELRIEQQVPDRDRTLLVLCASGSRSLYACESLRSIGYADVHSVDGGFSAWRENSLPVETTTPADPSYNERYRRHLIIPEIGEAGQKKLLNARVVLVGAGGLGCPAAYYLAAAGVGWIGVVDDDVIDRSNLQRQILHADWRVGHSKSDSARDTLKQLNPTIEVESIRERLTADNIDRIFSGADLVVDGCDNFATRYLVNEACVASGIPNVYGSVQRFEGQVSVFWPARDPDAPCYKCLYPAPPPAAIAPSCAEAGVLGVLPGVIGTLQASEALKILIGLGEPLVGRLLVYDALAAKFAVLGYRKNAECSICGRQA